VLPADRPLGAVVLDAGGVLLLPDPEAIRAGFGPLGAEPDDETCRRAHYVSMRELDRLDAPDWHAIDRVYAREAGVPEAGIEAAIAPIEDTYLRRPWTPIAGAAEALRRLEAAGIPLAIVSNAEGTMERQLAEHRICAVGGGEAAEVAVVVDSTVVGIEKPDPRIFDLALDALGVEAAACLYVGDTVHFDVRGAAAAGLHPVHVDPFGLCPDGDHPHVESVAALTAALLPAP
jgi:putative hydrolase of the HAD superfamily